MALMLTVNARLDSTDGTLLPNCVAVQDDPGCWLDIAGRWLREIARAREKTREGKTEERKG
ncbi:hypothetical protein NQZ68_021634 [Dissostichus eleginoides]|nr:hypothetical protein NQZ68_021634 [Dissostichus eleginoides]